MCNLNNQDFVFAFFLPKLSGLYFLSSDLTKTELNSTWVQIVWTDFGNIGYGGFNAMFLTVLDI